MQFGHVEFTTQPKEIVFRDNKLILYRFRPKVKKTALTPLLIVFSLMNRPDILDFSAEQSFIKGLLEAGRDVYLVDWGYPTYEDRHLTLSFYLTYYLKNCITQIQNQSRQKTVDLLGICQGGVLSLCYASLFPKDLRHLILISTPVDFQTKEDVLSRLAQKVVLESVVKQQGNIPGPFLAKIFSSLRPFQAYGKKYLSLLDHLSENEVSSAWLKQWLLIEKWLLDTPDLAGQAFLEFVKIFYQQNSFVHGKFMLDKHCIDIKTVKVPVLNVIARDDHIVPPRASRALKKQLSLTDYSVRILPAGHIGIYISQKTHKQLPKLIAAWLQKKEAVKAARRVKWKTPKKEAKKKA
jgi:polyhydroxyalkanoate synthase